VLIGRNWQVGIGKSVLTAPLPANSDLQSLGNP
jgi:hypothetical protein